MKIKFAFLNGIYASYPQPGNAQHDFYAVSDVDYYYNNDDSRLIGYGEHAVVTILRENGKYYPQLIDYPGQPAERRVKLLTDVNVPDLQGTLTIDSQGGSNATLYANDYTYDVIGRIKNISEQRQHRHIEHSYTYNNVGKLIEATTDGVTQTWQYDANGNRTHENNEVVASYDAQDRLTQYKDNTYQYNALGQLTQKTTPSGTEAYDYDVFGNLRGVTLANGVNIEYLIDPKDRRIGKKVNGAITQKLLYLGQLNPIAELYPDNSVKNLFIYAEKSNVPSAMERYDQSGNLLGKFRIISNHLGSVVMVVNAETGDIAQEIEYDVWGNVLNDTNPDFQPFYFAGGIYDSDTKLTRFGARDYDAETGRWTAKDPIGFAGGLTSLYDYVNGDPVNYVDPSGLAKDPKIRPDIWGHGKKPDGSPKDPHVDYVDEKGKRRIRTAEEIKDPKQNIPRRHRKKVEEVLKIMLQKIDDLRSPILICPAHICNNPYFLPPTEYEPPMALLEENKKPLYCE